VAGKPVQVSNLLTTQDGRMQWLITVRETVLTVSLMSCHC
jgi:hypothetical protein